MKTRRFTTRIQYFRALPTLLRGLCLGLALCCLCPGAMRQARADSSGAAETATNATAAQPNTLTAAATSTAAAAPPEAAAPNPLASPQPVSVSPLKIGLEQYTGTSNIATDHRYSDGMWIGSSLASPSVGYLRWDNGKGTAARLSVGLGSEYTGSSSLLQQPVEAWWQMPVGKASMTVGKFYVPFALQEWEYETKPGVMLQWAEGRNTLALSANYNHTTRAANSYLRLGHSFGPVLNLGVSLGAGSGLSFDSPHDRAWGLDGTLTWRGWQLTGEYEEMRTPSAQTFSFMYGKLAYNNLGRWKPWVGAYHWNDEAEVLGRYRSGVYGLGYQLTPNLTVEGGYAPTALSEGQQATWLQIHSTWER